MSLTLVTSYEEGEKESPHRAQVQRRRGGTVTGETPNSETLNFGVHAVASLIPVHQNSVSVADARGQMKTADAPGLLPSSWDFQPSRLSARPDLYGVGALDTRNWSHEERGDGSRSGG